jgi:hypothetical protein
MVLGPLAQLADGDPHPSCAGRPHAYLGHQDFSASNSATGYSPKASATMSSPE